MPRISVVIPTRDRVELLDEAISSLLRQRFDDWEALVVDDGTEDQDALRSVASRDPRLRLIHRREVPPGANHCRNLGLAVARGEFVVFLDSDDLLSEECVGRRIEVMDRHPELDAAIFPHRHFVVRPGDSTTFWPAIEGQDDITRFLRVDIPWQTAGPTWRRSALARFGPWDERLTCWQDWEFHVRALALGARYRCFDAPAFFHRVTGPHRESISGRVRSPADVWSQTLAIVSAFQLLRSRGLLDSTRHLALRRILLNAAESARGRSLDEALTVWREGLAAGLLTPLEHRLGQTFLVACRIRVVRGVLRRVYSAVARAEGLRARPHGGPERRAS